MTPKHPGDRSIAEISRSVQAVRESYRREGPAFWRQPDYSIDITPEVQALRSALERAAAEGEITWTHLLFARMCNILDESKPLEAELTAVAGIALALNDLLGKAPRPDLLTPEALEGSGLEDVAAAPEVDDERREGIEQLRRTVRALELLAESHEAFKRDDQLAIDAASAKAYDECGIEWNLLQGGMVIGEVPKPSDFNWDEYLAAQKSRLAELEQETGQ